MNFEDIKKAWHSLTPEQKAELIAEELEGSGLTVVFGGSNRTTSEVCINIYNAKDLKVEEVLETVGNWIIEKNKNKSSLNHKNILNISDDD